MFDDPLFHFYIEPETVDAEGYNGKQEPFDIVAEKLTAGAVKIKLAAVNDRMLCDPFLLEADCPGRGNTEGNACNDSG
jgi:hypothetical protein